MMKSRAEGATLGKAMAIKVAPAHHNQAPMPGIFPDYEAPVIRRTADGGREMVDLRWGMPSSKKAILEAAGKRAEKLRAKGQEVDFPALLRMEPDKGTTNIRNTASAHWRPYLGPERRCLVPFTSFSEPDQAGGTLQPVWFAKGEDRPILFFAGVWGTWSGVRKIKTGWEDDLELYGFLTTETNPDVGAYHPKAMPVILTEPEEWDEWLSGKPWPDVAHLQRPLPAGVLQVVARGEKQDLGGAG